MGLRISTNVPSIAARRTLTETSKQEEKSLARLSSGSRITSAADDAAGLVISEKLKAGIRSINQANRNANDGISMVQTAEGGLNEVSNILVRLRELSVQAASDTIGDDERKFTDLEFQNLKQEITRISQVTEFNGKKLLNGEEEVLDFQVGMRNDPNTDRISFDKSKLNAAIENLGLHEVMINSKEGARGSLEKIDTALSGVSGQRAVLGALQNRLSSTSNNLQIQSENLSAANSRIRDTDFAEETAKNTQLRILKQAGTAVLSQANQQGTQALQLLG